MLVVNIYTTVSSNYMQLHYKDAISLISKDNWHWQEISLYKSIWDNKLKLLNRIPKEES